MRNHLLEESYSELKEQQSVVQPSELLVEAPTPEQEWLSKNIISHLQKAIDGVNVSRSHIPTFISRHDVRKHVEELQAVQNKMLEIWHNIQDVIGDKQPAQPMTQSHILSQQEIVSKVKALHGMINPSLQGIHGQAKFGNPENAKTFAEFLTAAGFKVQTQGVIVSYTRPSAGQNLNAKA